MLSLCILLLACFCSTRGQSEDLCPPAAQLGGKCSCKTYFDGACIVTCALATQQDLGKVADLDALCRGNAHFVLVHSKVDGLPARLWKQLLSSRTVDVTLKHSSLGGLVPVGETIPQTKTPGAAVIKIEHCKIARWEWSQLASFYPEGELTVVVDDTPLGELGSDFSRIASGQVHHVTVDGTGLTALSDREFVSFEHIVSLSLQNNELKSFSRSMVAAPANNLKFLALNGNSLSSLPDDLLTEMPALEVVYLRDNRLTSLSSNLFRDISSPKLQRIDLVANPWHCDCALLKTLQSTNVHLNMGNCATPEEMAGKKISDLSKLLQC